VDSLCEILNGRVVVAGVGVVERGDDGFGPRLARLLSDVPRIRAVDCGDRLEDYAGDIARERPDTVLIADAVDLGAEPGRVAVLAPESLASFAGGTHRASLEATMRYLERRTGAAVFVLGMQPAVVADRPWLSPAVSAGLEALEGFFRSWSGNGEETPPSQPKRVDP
jgi:hydrogenase maturation protease